MAFGWWRLQVIVIGVETGQPVHPLHVQVSTLVESGFAAMPGPRETSLCLRLRLSMWPWLEELEKVCW